MYLVCLTPWLVQQPPCHYGVVILVQPATQPVAAEHNLLHILLQCSGGVFIVCSGASAIVKHRHFQLLQMTFDHTGRTPYSLGKATHLVQVATGGVREEEGVALRLILQLVRVIFLRT
jgi:hypothetical protein